VRELKFKRAAPEIEIKRRTKIAVSFNGAKKYA
jgi:hypothetical protein